MKKNELNEIVKNIFEEKLASRGGTYNIGSTDNKGYAVVDANKKKMYFHIDLPFKKFENKLLVGDNWAAEIQEVVDKIAKAMGHNSSNTTVKHYIDSNVLVEFFNRFNIEPPKIISNMIVTAALKMAANDDDEYINVTSDPGVSKNELEFNDWMETLDPEIIETEGTDVNGDVDSEEQFFI